MYKKNYRNAFNRCIFIDENQNIDINFMKLAKKQAKLTFNTEYLNPTFIQTIHTPFTEIERYDNFLNFTQDPIVGCNNASYINYIKEIIETFKNFLRQIDPSEQYFFSCSAGSDSRIITALLAQLRDEEGYNFDNILFHCWGRPEKDSFLALMNRFGWKNISILDDTVPDVYDVGTGEISTNGWYPYLSQKKFWGNIEVKDYILLSGAEGETLLWPFERWKHSHSFFSNRGESIHTLAGTFKDILFPYITKEMLNVTMKIPSCYKNIPDIRISRDKIRTDLCDLLGVLNIPMPKSTARFNYNISQDRKKLMIDLWNKCKFKKEFKIDINYDDLFNTNVTFTSKMWGFAVTVYERLFS